MKYKTYNIITYGCQMNHSDSERFAAFLENLGLRSVDHFQEADVVVLNSCSVRQKAEDRINGAVKNIRNLTQEKPPFIILSGCIARRIWDDKKNVINSSQKNYEHRARELKRIFPQVDLVVETKNFSSISDKLGFKPNFNLGASHYLSFKPKYKSNFQAYVPISTGCNHFCTFCIVPFARGKEVCRDAESIIREVLELVQSGFKDITLLGQTVNRWINPKYLHTYEYNEALTKIPNLNKVHMDASQLSKWREFFELKMTQNTKAMKFDDLVEPKDFLQLLEVLDQIPSKWWTTWISSHPNYMTSELIQFIAKSSLLNIESNATQAHQRPYLHFALQSGNDRILKKMNRRYTVTEFSKIVKQMDKNITNLNLSTDIIVGFLDESEEEFIDTIEVQESLKFDMIYISEYSPRETTASARLKDKVGLEEKALRKQRLNDVLKKIALEKNQRLVGTTVHVLVDGMDRKSKALVGRSVHNKLVRIVNTKDKSLIGKFVNVQIQKCTAWSLHAKLVE